MYLLRLAGRHRLPTDGGGRHLVGRGDGAGAGARVGGDLVGADRLGDGQRGREQPPGRVAQVAGRPEDAGGRDRGVGGAAVGPAGAGRAAGGSLLRTKLLLEVAEDLEDERLLLDVLHKGLCHGNSDLKIEDVGSTLASLSPSPSLSPVSLTFCTW